MAARRERTTALPRHRPRASAQTSGRRVAGIEWTEGRLRALIMGTAAVLLIAVIAALGWRIYDQQVRTPNQVILQVGDQQFKLNYYTDRLLPWLQTNQASGASASILEEQLLGKLEEEALTIAIARDRGIEITAADINQGIANSLGISAATGSFDTLYRQKLDETGMSDANYRRMVEASVANDKLLEQLRAEVGDKGEQLELRTIVVGTKEEAEATIARINDGEDMGTIAQGLSNDLESRQQDGLMPPEPAGLLPTAVAAAAEGKPTGEILGPVEVQGNWWVFRIERREEMDYSEPQKGQLAQLRLDELIAEKRAQVDITRSLDADDIRWAEKNLG
ncbi:MAG: SurA N-terminal domain-containing protein [Dehalococcoidia bacterium]|nr:SurA N-terminal domain-containing protein [Dehalococcoidia bacterium]